MSKAYTLTPTLEDYLEAIGRLVARKGDAHAKDIAHAVSVHISTVTTALRSLSEKVGQLQPVPRGHPDRSGPEGGG